MEEARPIIVEGGMKYEIGDFDINELKLWKDNPRTISKEELERLKKSIKRKPYFMSARPIVLSDRTGEKVIIAGNQRYKAVKELGWAEVPCILFHCETEEQEVEIAMVDNHNNGEWDVQKLSEKFMNYPLEDWLGSDWEKLAGEFGKETKEVKEDEVPEVDDKPAKTKLGDIYQLGNHRLMCGDSTKEENVEKLMNGEKADMVFTDPPYQIDTRGGGLYKKSHSMTEIKDNGVDEFDPSRLSLWAKTNIFFHNKQLIKKYIELAEKNNAAYDLAIYKKPGLPNHNGHLMTDIEYIAIIGKQNPNQGLSFQEYSKVYEGKKDQDNSLSYSKPIGLCAKFIKLFAKTSVLDLFGGSGSTLIASEQLERKCFMMELDPKYCDVIVERWEKFTGEKAKRINE